jgi:hypothetical protein
MNNKNNLLRLGGCIFVAILTLSCYFFKSTPGTSKGTPGTSNPYVAPITNVPQAVTELPPLPEFNQLLTFGFGGGSTWNCLRSPAYDGPVPAASGGLAYSSATNHNNLEGNLMARIAYLCLWGFPDSESFNVSLVSSDGLYTLSGSFTLSQMAVFDSGKNLLYEITFWWPGDLPSGIWKIEVTWQGGSVKGNFDAGNKSLPEISLEDTREKSLFVQSCHPAANQTEFYAIGESFPANSPAYILLYENNPIIDEGGMRNLKLVWSGDILSDSNGHFRSRLPYEFKSGVIYQLIGVTDPNINIADHVRDFTSVDCFVAPIKPGKSSCPGAPPQRMVPGQLGYVCSQKDLVNIHDAPAKSSTAIDVLSPDNQFQVVGGPQCADNQSWWQIQTSWGTTGWVPEGGEAVNPYLICPLP